MIYEEKKTTNVQFYSSKNKTIITKIKKITYIDYNK